MQISAQISLYPLGKEHLQEEIRAFVGMIEARGLHCTIGGMSTIVAGDSTVVFPALQEAFEYVASHGGYVMAATVSNACPA